MLIMTGFRTCNISPQRLDLHWPPFGMDYAFKKFGIRDGSLSYATMMCAWIYVGSSPHIS